MNACAAKEETKGMNVDKGDWSDFLTAPTYLIKSSGLTPHKCKFHNLKKEDN